MSAGIFSFTAVSSASLYDGAAPPGIFEDRQHTNIASACSHWEISAQATWATPPVGFARPAQNSR
jgi:hypothetical protein